MKRLFATALVAGLALSAPVRAEGPDDQYIQIYKLIQDADQLAASSQSEAARQKYLEAQTELKQLQTSYPVWNERLVHYRLRMLEDRLAGFSKPAPPAVAPATSSVPATPAPSAAAPPATPAVEPAPVVPPASAVTPAPAQADDRDRQIQALRRQVATLQGERSVLEAKLREALAAQPASVDPRELARAEARIRSLEKEKEILRVSTEVAEAKAARPSEPGAAEARKDLAAARQKIREQDEVITALRQEKEVLAKRVDETRRSNDDILKTLRAENETLKKELAGTKPAQAAESGTYQKELASTQAALQSTRDTVASLQVRLRSLQEERDQLDKVRQNLEQQLASARTPAPNANQVKALQVERDALQQQLAQTTRQLTESKASPPPPAPPAEDVSRLRARLNVLEANKVPYTPEELALFKKPADGALAASATIEPKPAPDAAAKVGPLLAEAQRAFASRHFDEAEQKYKEAIQMDSKNAAALQRLGAAQLEQNHPKEAEATLKVALAQNPADAHTLLLMGIAKFDQEKYDEALDSLSRSAQIDPKNPETQNYLGITLSQKGQREAAETALRKAIELDPGYKSAHYNLAVVYATQQPPFLELARWHYQKALAYGHPASPDLEKLLERKPTASAK